MLKLALTAILLSYSHKVNALDEWSKTDTALEATYLTLHVTDWLQTRYVVNNERFFERNNFLGQHPTYGEVNRYFILTGIGHVILARILPKGYRHFFQTGTIGMEIACTVHNTRAGIGIRF